MDPQFFVVTSESELFWLTQRVAELLAESTPVVLRVIEEDFSDEEKEVLDQLKDHHG